MESSRETLRHSRQVDLYSCICCVFLYLLWPPPTQKKNMHLLFGFLPKTGLTAPLPKNLWTFEKHFLKSKVYLFEQSYIRIIFEPIISVFKIIGQKILTAWIGHNIFIKLICYRLWNAKCNIFLISWFVYKIFQNATLQRSLAFQMSVLESL